VALIAAACSAAATPAVNVYGATATPTTAAMSATTAPAAMATPSATPAVVAGLNIGSTDDPTLGPYLTGQNGMTLYVLTKDTPNTTTCTGSCATNWPPLTVAGGAKISGPGSAKSAFATINRPDGTVQVTYNHMPLYYFAGDSASGDTNGEGKLGTWFVAPLSGVLSANAPGATATSNSNSGY
jgi:predicted lipoprotein with Yx(FWY)xxD motif